MPNFDGFMFLAIIFRLKFSHYFSIDSWLFKMFHFIYFWIEFTYFWIELNKFLFDFLLLFEIRKSCVILTLFCDIKISGINQYHTGVSFICLVYSWLKYHYTKDKQIWVSMTYHNILLGLKVFTTFWNRGAPFSHC